MCCILQQLFHVEQFEMTSGANLIDFGLPESNSRLNKRVYCNSPTPPSKTEDGAPPFLVLNHPSIRSGRR